MHLLPEICFSFKWEGKCSIYTDESYILSSYSVGNHAAMTVQKGCTALSQKEKD
jgi:hypothetical protein